MTAGARRIAPFREQRDPGRFGVAPHYGWSEDKARQYAVPQRADFGAYVRRNGLFDGLTAPYATDHFFVEMPDFYAAFMLPKLSRIRIAKAWGRPAEGMNKHMRRLVLLSSLAGAGLGIGLASARPKPNIAIHPGVIAASSAMAS